MITAIAAVYLVGIGLGLVFADARWPLRILLAICWPLGPAVFVVLISALAVVAVGLWPARLLPLVLVAAGAAYLLMR